ncbi:MAG: hypothetical protein A2Z29_09275 [Chloroflexi bacterium RBG_16_56_11]|nr:MAG: hypothetical protein A2Z29_09275 [Chloroflexi bacterium RBG_16_56_11]
MAGTKYGDLVKKLSFREGRGGANAKELVFVGGDEMAGFEFNFIVGVYNQTGDWAPNRGAHAHTFDECLLFFGYDDKDMSYLGSDMELSLGKELEKHKFSVPTVAVAPKGVPHCPLVTEKVYKPFGHFHLALAAKYSGEGVKAEGTTDGKKYRHLVKQFRVKKGTGGADAVQTISMSGAELEGLNLNFTMGLYNKTGPWSLGEVAHVHPYDECLIFFGHNTDNLSYLGAELTIDIGGEHEKHTFSDPTVVSIPRGLPHFPIVCKKVERPYRVMRVGLGPRYVSSKAV